MQRAQPTQSGYMSAPDAASAAQCCCVLQDPSDRRQVLSDATLKQLTGQDRFQAFGFAKLFNKHLYPDG